MTELKKIARLIVKKGGMLTLSIGYLLTKSQVNYLNKKGYNVLVDRNQHLEKPYILTFIYKKG